MSRTRLRQSLRQDVSFKSPSALARRRASVQLSVALLRQKFHALRRIAASLADAYGREAIRLSRVQQAIHALRSPVQTFKDARAQAKRQKEQRRRRQFQRIGKRTRRR